MRAAIFFALALVAIPAHAHAAWESRTIAGVDTRIYTPGSVSPIGDGRALMLGLHGCSQTADDLKTHANLEATAEDFGVVIALPNVPGGGVYAGCWSYYGPIHTRDGGHEGPVIELVHALRDDPQYVIDPAQMYLAGFSAGGGEAVVLGCLAPDLFAGIGIAAGPAAGTTGDDIQQVGTTVEEATAVCEMLAGSYAADLASQVAVTFTDTNDFIVAQGYAELNARMYAQLFAGGVDAMTAAALDVASLPGAAPQGTGTTWADADGPRIAWIVSSGVGHAWPAGSGAATGALTFVSGNGLNFSYYLAEFFAANNRRASGDWMPGGDDGAGSDGDDGGSEDGAGSNGDEGVDASDDTAGDDGADDAAGDDAADDDTDPTTPDLAMDDYIEPIGCQCRARPHASGSPALLVLAAIARRRRRACA